MLIQCVICSDLLTQSALGDLMSLTCGHIFHGHCIRTWLKRSQTCPQCRAKTPASNRHKIYLTIMEGKDVFTLSKNLDSLQKKFMVKELERKDLARKLGLYKTKTAQLKKRILDLKTMACIRKLSLRMKHIRKRTNQAFAKAEAKYAYESSNELQQYKILRGIIDNLVAVGPKSKRVGNSQMFYLMSILKKSSTKSSLDVMKTLIKTEDEYSRFKPKKNELHEGLVAKNESLNAENKSTQSNEAVEPKSPELKASGPGGSSLSTSGRPPPFRKYRAAPPSPVPNVVNLPTRSSSRIKARRTVD